MACVSRPWPVERVPFELWHRIFQDMSLDGILVVMQVCWLWRAVAFECNAYASDIVLERPKHSAAELFLLRLRRTASRQPTLEVSIDQPWELLGTLVMPAIEEHLSGIGALSLKCHSADAASVMDRLRRPALRLRRLRLAFILDQDSSAISRGLSLDLTHPPIDLPGLPLDLLDNHAPNLKSLSLDNVDFLPGPMTRTLSSVIHLHMGYSPSAPRQRSSERMWKYFPALSALTLSGPAEMWHPVYRDPQSWRTIQQLHLDLEVSSAYYLLKELKFLSKLPIIRVFHPYEWTMRQCRSHIPGPLDVAIRSTTLQRSEVCFTDRNTRLTRVYTARWTPGYAPEIHSLLELHATPERMISLTISATWEWLQIAAFGMKDQNLSSLRFIVDDGIDFALLGTQTKPRFDCLSVESLVLRSESATPLVMSYEDVEAFVGSALDLPQDAEGRPRCSLVLENVNLVGPLEILDGRFCKIQHDDLSRWRYPFTPPPEA